MNRATLIRGARQLLTLSGETGPRAGPASRELRIINDGAVLVIDGRIAEVGPSRRVERLNIARKAAVFEANGRVVMPGLVDCCVSLLCGTPRWGASSTVAEARELRGWSAQRMRLEARTRAEWFMRTGTTTLGAGCGVAFDLSTELKALRVLNTCEALAKVAPALYAHRIPPDYEDRPQEYRDWLARELISEVRRRGLAETVETGDWPEVCEAVRTAGLSVRIRRTDGTVSARAAMVHLPGGPAPNEPGKPVVLSSGFHSTHRPFCGMQTMIWIARNEWKMSLEEAITASTINAAYALREDRRVGSLEPGKDADILILQSGDCRDLGWYLGTSLVAAVIRSGAQIFP